VSHLASVDAAGIPLMLIGRLALFPRLAHLPFGRYSRQLAGRETIVLGGGDAERHRF